MNQEQLVRAMLDTMGVAPSDDEVARLAAGYSSLRRMIDSLYAIEAARHAEMGLTFLAEPVSADWAAEMS